MANQAVATHTSWRRAVRRMVAETPLMRWPLLLGLVLAVPLPFMPWAVIYTCGLTCTDGSYVTSVAINPLHVFLADQATTHRLLNLPHLFVFAGLLSLVLPGILGIFWVRGSLHTGGQRIAAVLVSTWAAVFIVLGWYAWQWLPASGLLVSFAGSETLSPGFGMILFCLVTLLLSVGTLFLWFDMWRGRDQKDGHTVS